MTRTKDRYFHRYPLFKYDEIKTVRPVGFTLVELLVVISIIGVLMALVLVNFAGVRERARDMQRKTELNEVKKALRLYFNDNSRYPAQETLPDWGMPFVAGTMTYMKELPSDPLNNSEIPDSQQYSYYQTGCTNGADDYRLVAILENASDPDIERAGTRCGSGCGFTFDSGSNHYVLCPD